MIHADMHPVRIAVSIIAIACASFFCPVSALELDQPPGERNLPHYPAIGDTVRVNPPPFIWVPVDKVASYRVEVSQSRDFSGEVIRSRDTDISTVALERTLSPGTWFWRYLAESNSGETAVSTARRFSVPVGIPKLPFPDITVLARGVPKSHPRLFVTRDRLDTFRRNVMRDRAEDIARFHGSASKWIGEEIIKEPPFVTGEGTARSELYLKIFRSTRPPMDRMERSALLYLLTGDKASGDEAKRRILHFFSWDPEGSTAYANNDEPAMWVMMRGIRAYDWTYDMFSPAERELVERSMRIRARQFYDHLKQRRKFHTDPFESHAGRTLGFLGEASLMFLGEWPEAEEYLRYVLTCFWNVYPAWGKEDGGWHEGPSYWSYYMEFALHFIVSLRELSDADLLDKPFFHNTPYYKLYTNPPYAKISPFGDGEHAPPNGSMGELMYWFGALVDDPHFIWYGESMGRGPGTNVIGFVVGNDHVAKAPADLPPCRYFPGVGLVSMHTAFGDADNDIHFLIHSDPYGAISHGHADQNAFTIEAFGEALAIASGYYPYYGSDHHRNWQWHSRSSNTVTFDSGEGQVIRDADSKGRIVAFEQGESFDYTLADATDAYGGKLARCLRHVLHIRPGIFVMFDELESPEPHSFEWRLHALEQMRLDTASKSLIVNRNDARMMVGFFTPDSLVFDQTNTIDWPSEDGNSPQWYFTATLPNARKSCRFVTVLIPYRSGQAANLPEITAEPVRDGFGLVVRKGNDETVVVFRDADAKGTVLFGGVTTDARVAVVKTAGGDDRFSYGGTTLNYAK